MNIRLIDADKLIEILKSDSGSILEKSLFGIVGGQPTAFDLESVIEQINDAISSTECYRHRFCENMTVDQCSEHEDCEFCVAEKIIEILKSQKKDGD